MELKTIKNKVFYIHNTGGSLMRKERGYKNALSVIKKLDYVAQLNYEDAGSFQMVYAHVPKGEKLKSSQMFSSMKNHQIQPNKEIVESKQKENKYGIDKLRKLYDLKLTSTTEYKQYIKKEFHGHIPSRIHDFIEQSRTVEDFLKKVKQLNETKGESKMKIKMTELKEMIREILNEESGYPDFFKATLKKFGVKSPAELEDEKKKEFFNYIDANWDAKKETDVDETLEPVSQAGGTKRVKARKRDQILAAEAKVETYVRKIVKEELKFVMFNEIPGTISRKVAKKRIIQTGNTTKSL